MVKLNNMKPIFYATYSDCRFEIFKEPLTNYEEKIKEGLKSGKIYKETFYYRDGKSEVETYKYVYYIHSYSLKDLKDYLFSFIKDKINFSNIKKAYEKLKNTSFVNEDFISSYYCKNVINKKLTIELQEEFIKFSRFCYILCTIDDNKYKIFIEDFEKENKELCEFIKKEITL